VSERAGYEDLREFIERVEELGAPALVPVTPKPAAATKPAAVVKSKTEKTPPKPEKAPAKKAVSKPSKPPATPKGKPQPKKKK